jgi:hypothetical protein
MGTQVTEKVYQPILHAKAHGTQCLLARSRLGLTQLLCGCDGCVERASVLC